MRRVVNISASIAALAAAVLICAGCGTITTTRDGVGNNAEVNVNDKQSEADKYAKQCYNVTAEYLAEQFTLGRHNDIVLNEGDLADAVTTDGLSFNKEQYSQGEQYLFDNLSKIDSAILDGTVYLTFNSLDTDSGYDMTVTWESPNGVIGSYRNDFVGYNSTQTENNEDPENDYNTENDENTDERVDLSQANANAKIFFNCLAEYLADEYTMGRTYPTVLDEGDLALTTSPEGMPLDGEITAKGDSYLA